MKICYIDESGGFEAHPLIPDSAPLMAIAGVILDDGDLHHIMKEFLGIKTTFFPGRFPRHRHSLDCMLDEIKGSDVRRAIRGKHRQSRQATTFLGAVLDLMTRYRARVVGRVWIKEPNKALDPDGSYTYAVQDMARHFQKYLTSSDDAGLLICDGRDHAQDAKVAHSLFTQKHRSGGDAYPSLIETATFGRSVNHVGLQLSDLVVAGLIYPMAASVFCPDHVAGLKNGATFESLRQLHGPTLKALRYTWRDSAGKLQGGLVVSDKLNHRPSGSLFS